MYQNYRKIGNKGVSIAMMIIALLLAVLFLVLALSIDKTFSICFFFFMGGCLLESVGAAVVFVKCLKYGDESAFKNKTKELTPEEKAIFDKYNKIVTYLNYASFGLGIVGLVLLIIL